MYNSKRDEKKTERNKHILRQNEKVPFYFCVLYLKIHIASILFFVFLFAHRESKTLRIVFQFISKMQVESFFPFFVFVKGKANISLNERTETTSQTQRRGNTCSWFSLYTKKLLFYIYMFRLLLCILSLCVFVCVQFLFMSGFRKIIYNLNILWKRINTPTKSFRLGKFISLLLQLFFCS